MSDELVRLLRGAQALSASTGIRIAVIGGVARGVWASPRATLDLDLIAGTHDASQIEEAASDANLIVVEEEARGLAESGMTRLRLAEHPRGAVRIDVILAQHPFYQRVLDRAREAELLGTTIRVACPEDLILLKLLADRAQDRADVEAIVTTLGDRLDLVLLAEEADLLEISLPPALNGPSAS